MNAGQAITAALQSRANLDAATIVRDRRPELIPLAQALTMRFGFGVSESCREVLALDAYAEMMRYAAS